MRGLRFRFQHLSQNVLVRCFPAFFRHDLEMLCAVRVTLHLYEHLRAFVEMLISRTYRRIPAYPSMETWRCRSREPIRATISSAVGRDGDSSAAAADAGSRNKAASKRRFLIVKTPKQIFRGIHAKMS